MKHLRWLLLPFSLVYGLIVRLRNVFYNLGIYKTYKIPVKSIAVGNLSVGGTGKTPLVSYLVDHFLKNGVPVTTLSRGYGVLFANERSTASEIGDEPLQYKTQFGGNIDVVVAEKRVDGVEAILTKNNTAKLILLDDAFQHRAITAGMNILVTEFSSPFCNDFMLPTGRLREPRSGASRADIIIVSKCPENLSEETKDTLKKKLAKNGQKVFFSRIKYSDLRSINSIDVKLPKNVLLVTGIGNPTPLLEHLKKSYNVSHLRFQDHHDFTTKDIHSIHQKFNTFASRETIVVTTEKDYMRLRAFDEITDGQIPWFYQPINVVIENDEHFKNLLDTYVREN